MKRLLVLVALAACTDAETVVDPDVTALEIVIAIAPDLGIDSLLVSTTGKPPAFAPGTVPETPRPLAGEQSVAVLLPDGLDGTELVVRVDGLANGAIVASGGARATVRARTLQRVVVPLGDPATCGDGVVRDPIEACDDNNPNVGDGCADCTVEDGFVCTAPTTGPSMCRPDTFDLVTATSSGHQQLTIAFTDPPDPIQALELSHYVVPGLTVSGTPFLNGNQVVLATSPQDAIGYNVIVDGIARARDGAALRQKVGTFVGRTAFSVASARSTSATQIAVTFSEPPEPATATALASYAVPGLVLSGTPVLAGNNVTITTSLQTTMTYMLTATGVRRASDSEPLGVDQASFTGVNGFDVTAAISLGNREIAVTFNAPPNAAQAVDLANYDVPGLTLSGAQLAGSTVTLQTSTQSPITYTIDVSNVTRAGDGQALTLATAQFAGLPITNPTVTAVDVLSTVPDNGSTFYNTGTATVRITGTQLATVACPAGVVLDDLDGLGAAVATPATSCVVDSDSQITATFPAGIRTNGATGWNVIVTNSAGSNATSDKLVVHAGLLISEVYVGTNTHEFFELYNPTATAINASTLGLRLHTRSAMGTDTAKQLTFITATVPSHGFLLVSSASSNAADPWFARRDATYASNGIGANAGLYISTSTTAGLKVIDKVGWGTQPVGGFEGTALADIPAGQSAERKPAGGLGHATDSDVNANDFNPASTTLTPRGIADGPQP